VRRAVKASSDVIDMAAMRKELEAARGGAK
jgi:hypothetical protein